MRACVCVTYYEYKDTWDIAIDGLELPCEREHGPSAITVSRSFTLAKMLVFVSLKSLENCKGPRGLGGAKVFLDQHLCTSRSLVTLMQTFYLIIEDFTKNRDKFGWVKHWVFPCQNFVLYGILIACTHG